jgi:hypothetical protein
MNENTQKSKYIVFLEKIWPYIYRVLNTVFYFILNLIKYFFKSAMKMVKGEY